VTILTATISLCNETVLALAAAHIAQFAERLDLKQAGSTIAGTTCSFGRRSAPR
jgi:hypothetical protein